MKISKYILSAASAVFLSTGCGDTSGSQVDLHASPISAPKLSQATIDQFLDAINTARSKTQDCGSKGIKEPVDALEWDEALYRAAYEHNRDMAWSDTINHDHTGSGTKWDYTAQVNNLGRGSTFNERIINNGYSGAYPRLENLTVGQGIDTAQKAVEEWLKSDGHCANLMNPDVKKVGMSYLKKEGSHMLNYWTQDFGG